jgi:hypothetical protein
LFTVQDPFGRTIVLDEAWWLIHINYDHPGMEPDWIAQCLASPDIRAYDADYENRRVYYKRNYLPAPYRQLYMKVVIELPADPQDPCVVKTAYLTPRTKPGEKLEWPRSSV